MSIILTAHAIDRFRTRHVPHMTHAEAARALSDITPFAQRIPEKSLLGQDQWLIERPYNLILVCKNDPKVGIVAVTTLTEDMRGPSAEDVAEFRAAAIRNMLSMREAPPPVRAAPIKNKPSALDATARAAKQAAGLAAIAENNRRQAEESKARRDGRIERKGVIDQLNAQIAALKRRCANFDAHQSSMSRDRTEMRMMLRMLLRAVEPFVGLDPGITEAWDSVAGIEAGLVSDQFLGALPEQETDK